MIFSSDVVQVIVIIILSYLVGSLPTAYVIGRFRGINVFDVGSGNMGGTNIARAMGLHWGLATAAIDVCKGMFAVWLAQHIMPAHGLGASLLASIVAVTGHNWSIVASLLYAHYRGVFELRGGKGAATAMGTMLMLVPAWPIVAMLTLGVTLVIFTRYVSLGVLVAFGVALSWTIVLALQELLEPAYVPYAVIIAFLIVWRFRENIRRLISGTERKLGERVQPI